MKRMKLLLLTLMAVFLCSAAVSASEFEWMRGFNVEAGTDPSDFRARLETRFKIGDVAIDAVIGNTDSPADAYTCLRIGEMSHQPIERVLSEYKKGKSQGWGRIAKSLGIKPGSSEFHALKQGQDLYGKKGYSDEGGYGGGKSKKEGKGKGKK